MHFRVQRSLSKIDFNLNNLRGPRRSRYKKFNGSGNLFHVHSGVRIVAGEEGRRVKRWSTF